jgi:hypothetical protein
MASGGASSAPRAEPGLRGRRSALASRGPSIFGGGAPASSRPSAEVPFSDSWQSQATPDLTGPATGPAGPGGNSSSSATGSGTVAGGSPDSEGPAITSWRSPGGLERNSGRTGSEGAFWRSEAQKLSGQARALSGQLRQMERRQERSEAAENSSSIPEKSSTAASGSGGTASTSSGPGTPDDPDRVPIGGLGWLLATGVGYGAYKLRVSRLGSSPSS